MKAISIAMRDARIWAGRTDPEALQFWSSLADEQDPCWLCDQAVGPGGTISVLPDPKNPRVAIATPICGFCFNLPQPQRKLKEMRVISAMWPQAKFDGWRVQSKKKDNARR
jgi:hypothetical protein